MGKALVIYLSIFFILFTVYGVDGVPRSIGVLQPIFFIFGIGLNRAIIRYVLNDSAAPNLATNARRILIIGVSTQAQELGVQFLRATDKFIVGFVDESNLFAGNTINGCQVFSGDSLEKLLDEGGVQELHLINGELSDARRKQIFQIVERQPTIRLIRHNTLDQRINFFGENLIVDYQIDDLLGRSQVAVDESSIRFIIENNVIMITGAGGSIGSEICRQILDHNPRTILIVENSEHALYKIYEELIRISAFKKPSLNIVPLIASVTHDWRMRELISSWRPSVIFHAAAYKHVPIVESNPAEAILNNVEGTLICASLAIEYGVSRFILVSTDKAVRPTNIMGASKRLAEMILQGLAEYHSKDRYGSVLSMVRFGNVLGSSGSVVPLFARQIAIGGPITITHPDVTRYFMTIPEASRLVIQASILGKGGEVFLLEMGQPVKIIDLARRMILLSGKSLRNDLNSNGDIEIQITGLRPGEKLYEELLIGADPVITEHPKILRAMENFLFWPELEPKLMQLFSDCRRGNIKSIKLILSELVDGYKPHLDIVDLTYLERS